MSRTIRSICLAGLLAVVWAGAGAHGFVSVQPVTVEIVEPAGKKVSGTFLVKNPMETEMEVEVSPEPFQGAVGMADIPHASWLRIPKEKTFKLSPGAERKIKYQVRVPRGLSGETMVMVYFNANVPEPSMGGVTVKRRHGIPIYVTAKGSEKAEADVKKIYVRFSSTQTGSAMEFLIDVGNPGNVHLRPRGIVQVYRGSELLEETNLQSGYPIFPSAQHQYVARSARTFWEPGDYQAKAVVYYGEEYQKSAQKENTLGFKIGKDRKIDLLN